MNNNEIRKKFAEVIAKAWSDASFKARLLQEPTAVLNEYGITLPAGAEAKILEDTAAIKHFVLPTQPEDEGETNSIESIHTCP